MSILLFYGSSSSTSKALMICINFIQDVVEEHKKEHEEEATGRAHSTLMRKILRIHTPLPSLSSLSAFFFRAQPSQVWHSILRSYISWNIFPFLSKVNFDSASLSKHATFSHRIMVFVKHHFTEKKNFVEFNKSKNQASVPDSEWDSKEIVKMYF